jgi:hypothetical protein
MASGTAWLPAAAPMPAYHTQWGRWSLMTHGSVFVQFVRDFGTRGDYQLGSTNWIMAVATRPLGRGTLGARVMASAEPLTVTPRGYPQLLQVAEPYKGETLSDRMHPHDLVGEVALTYERRLAGRVAASVYLGAVGEPAVGPVAYQHRPSAGPDPATPLGHHAQDFAHITFGVATVGLSTERLRVEASVFNSEHPDEVRTDFDFEGAKLNSYAARVTANPSARWSVAASGAYMAAISGAHAHGAQHALGFAVLRTAPAARGGSWSSALIWGATVPTDTKRTLHALLLESALSLGPSNTVFGRAEYVRRSAEDLDLVGSVSAELDIGAVSLGYARRLRAVAGVDTWLGARGTVNLVPEELRLFYGSRTPLGLIAYLHIRPPLGGR